MRRLLQDKEVVLGITGSIAAYKACELASRLVEWGVRVTPVLTKSACQLVGPATLEAITGRRAIVEMFEPLQNPEIEHIAVATRADLFLIAPATANILAKAANGIADDWLSTTLLATLAPILFAPAMNSNMYAHHATQANIETLRGRGCHFVGPDAGRLACGTVGPGRLADSAAILEVAVLLLCRCDDLAGRRVLITTGATREAIDPVRYITNHSSGKMGRALAMEALRRGAEVTVVTGPAEIQPPNAAEVVQVETAEEMQRAVTERAIHADVFIAAAAVADYRVDAPASSKHKRGEALTLNLVANPDILAGVAAARRPGQIIVGFAAETGDLETHGRAKLDRKGLDLLIANEVGGENSAFGSECARALLLSRKSDTEDLSLLPKEEIAERLFDRIALLFRPVSL